MRLKATREGKRFVLAVLIVGFASLNTGNNLMYLIFAMLFSVFVLSVLLPYLTLRGIQLEIEIEEPVYAKAETFLTIEVRNRKALLPSYSIRLDLAGLVNGGIYFDRLGPGECRKFSRRVTFEKRGYFSLSSLQLSTSFPFIFFELKRPVKGERTVLVYPEIVPVEDELFFSLRDTGESHLRGMETEEASTIRQYQRGDSLKLVHWKTTAKQGKLMVREFYQGRAQQLTLLFDNTPYEDRKSFERAVSLAASICYRAITYGYPLRLITCKKTIPFGTGMEQLFKCLDLLAIIKMEREINCQREELAKGAVVAILSSPYSPFSQVTLEAQKVYYANRL